MQSTKNSVFIHCLHLSFCSLLQFSFRPSINISTNESIFDCRTTLWSSWECQNIIFWRWNRKKLDGLRYRYIYFSVLSTAYTFLVPLHRSLSDKSYRYVAFQCKNVGSRICTMRKSSNSNDQCICSVQKFLFLFTVYIFFFFPHFVKCPILPQCCWPVQKCGNFGIIGNICSVYSTKVSGFIYCNFFVVVSCHRL